MDSEDKAQIELFFQRSDGDQVEEVEEVLESSNEKKCYATTPLLSVDPAVSERLLDEQVEVTESLNEKKCCTDCHTSKTPLWRGGPAGPKSLCNACGIKYNKKRRSQMSEFDKNGRRMSKVVKRNGDLKLKMKMRLTVINQKQPPLHQHHHHQQQHHHHQQQQQQLRRRKRSSYERGKPWWNKLREEEQAAILLMAISCGGSMFS